MNLHERLRRDLQAVAVDDGAWPTALEHLADYLGATEAVLGGAQPGRTPDMFAPRTDPGHVAVYEETYHQQNMLMRAVLQQGMGVVTLTDGLAEIAQFRRSDFYNQWCVPQGFNHAITLSLASSSGWVGAIVVNTRQPVSVQQQADFEALAPDLRRAVEQWRALVHFRSANRLTLDTLELAGMGALFLDRQGRVQDSNATGQAILQDGQLCLRDGRLCGADARSDATLSALIARCMARPDQGGGRLHIAGPLGPLQVQCTPFPGDMDFPLPQRPRVIVLVTDPQQKLKRRVLAMAATHGLTHAEIEMALAIVQTGSRKAAAEARGVSDATARSQLTSIFDKTGVRRQTELVRLVMDDS